MVSSLPTVLLQCKNQDHISFSRSMISPGLRQGFISWLALVRFFLCDFWWCSLFALALPFHGSSLYPYWVNKHVPAIPSTLPTTFLPPHRVAQGAVDSVFTHQPLTTGAALVGSVVVMTLLWQWTLGLELRGRLRLALSCCCLCYWLALRSTALILLHSTLPLCPGDSFPEGHHLGETGPHMMVPHLYQVLSVWLWTLLTLSEPLFSYLWNGNIQSTVLLFKSGQWWSKCNSVLRVADLPSLQGYYYN